MLMSTVERRDSIESTAEGVWLLIDVKVKPDMIQATRQRLHAALTEIRAFDGCRSATLLVNQDDVNNLLIVERWVSRAHFERYRAWRADRGDHDRLVATLEEPLAVRAFDIVG
jgi:quinol monooxygenase YgiN